MEITKESLLPVLMYNKPMKYDEHITLYPVTMGNVLLFQALSSSITVRKNSIFRDKKIIKMTYLDFLKYCYKNTELEDTYHINNLSEFLVFFIQLLHICCKDADIKINNRTFEIFINDELLTPNICDDLRRIIIIQNDIDFDIDEFVNYDTEQKLLKAENSQNKNNVRANIEDYIDSLVIILNTTEEQIMNMTIRKFWRYIKRFRLYENYTLMKTGEYSGMVTYKEPIKYWMITLDEEDKYGDLKTDEETLKGKIG